MENLLLLLNKISQVSPLGVFSQEVIVVQNPGMQHWLNLAIAQERGISMNMGYALPAQYLWKLIRTLASDENVPEQSPYSREVLTWRIYALLATEELVNDVDFIPATRYWNNTSQSENAYSSQENLKRYQLAEQMADLYEQYLIFRPEWLDSWEKGKALELLSNDNKWQAKLWLQLINQLAYNPVELLNDAIANIESKFAADPLLLPKRLSFFGINSMAPMWLTFINALSDYIEVDFYHLNPCFSYWGDIISEKQAIKQLSHWSKGVDDDHLFVGNPLLANLGQQGREFLALLQDYSTVNVELFVKASDDKAVDNENDDHEKLPPTEKILHKLQNDILELNDATKAPVELIDDSITLVSCHSALREVQALHDFLLHQFNDSVRDSNNTEKLTPKDVLVMCPQIEQYAPYVNAVFTRGWQDLNDEVPPLPCSIADRSAKDSDPLIAAFSELLTLPDSRFQVSHLLSFIRLPAVANKFSINEEDSEKISGWLQQATVHWGLDKSHKAKLLGENVSNSFTWQQGLSRLLRGFAFSDTDSIYQEQLLLAAVEGDDAILLGQLMLFIEQLQSLAQQLNSARTAKDWQHFLLSQLALLFATNRYFSNDVKKTNNGQVNNAQIINAQTNNQIESSLEIIEQAISALVEYCSHAHFDEKIDLAIVVDFLNNHFSQGDSSRQFMVGQVTFCSMLPMRSIPFKVIAVLGLNDGEFPRQRQPLGFDLMAQSPAKLGDRSRRGDDRYLFLEAIISARNSLYLSYQGRNIKNNNEKQPSLVLKELMDYLTHGYGWNFAQGNNEGVNNQLQQMPMQPFSEGNYLTFSPVKASFDANWLKLAQDKNDLVNEHVANESTLIIGDENMQLESISAHELIRFFQHPSKMFAQQALNLYLDSNDIQLDDVEPFSANYLDRYLLKEALLNATLAVNLGLDVNDDVEGNVATIKQVLHAAKLSGKFPDSPSTQADFDDWLDDTQQFSQEIIEQGCHNPELVDCQITVPYQQAQNQHSEQKTTSSYPIIVTAKIPVKKTHNGVQVVFYRSSGAKVKDLFTLFIHHLIVQLWQKQNIETEDYASNPLSQVQNTCGFYFNAKAQGVESYSVSSIENAEVELEMLLKTYEQGRKQALLLNSELAAHVFKQVRGKSIELTQENFEKAWHGDDSIHGLSDDPYIRYFWPQCPNISDYLPSLTTVYQSLYKHVSKNSSNKRKGDK